MSAAALRPGGLAMLRFPPRRDYVELGLTSANGSVVTLVGLSPVQDPREAPIWSFREVLTVQISEALRAVVAARIEKLRGTNVSAHGVVRFSQAPADCLVPFADPTDTGVTDGAETAPNQPETSHA